MTINYYYSNKGIIAIINEKDKSPIIKNIYDKSKIYKPNEIILYEKIPTYRKFVNMKDTENRLKQLEYQYNNIMVPNKIDMIKLELELRKEKEKVKALERNYTKIVRSYQHYLDSVIIDMNKKVNLNGK